MIRFNPGVWWLVAEIRELSSRVIRWSRVIKFDSILIFFFTETLVIF